MEPNIESGDLKKFVQFLFPNLATEKPKKHLISSHFGGKNHHPAKNDQKKKHLALRGALYAYFWNLF